MLTKEQLDELEREIESDVSAWDLVGLREALIAMARHALELETEVERLRNVERDHQEEELFKRDWRDERC